MVTINNNSFMNLVQFFKTFKIKISGVFFSESFRIELPNQKARTAKHPNPSPPVIPHHILFSSFSRSSENYGNRKISADFLSYVLFL